MPARASLAPPCPLTSSALRARGARAVRRVVVVLTLAASVLGAWRPAAAETGDSRTRLASELARTAAILASGEDAGTLDLETAWRLQSEACRLDPTSLTLARRQLELAMLIGDERAIDESLRAVNQLDPADDVVQLTRLMRAVDDRYQTAPERIDALRWLVDSKDASLGTSVRSRLAFELALLQRRAGNLDGFADALTTAVALDSSNRDAASLAAGFFRTHIDDPVAEAELLVSLILSDPTDPAAIVTFAKLLIDRGAFIGATRFLDLAAAILTERAEYMDPTLIGDRLIAHLAQGDGAMVDAILAREQKLMDLLEATRRRREDPDRDWSPLDIESIRGTLHPVLTGMRAVRYALADDAERQAAAVTATLSEYESMWNGMSSFRLMSDVHGARLRIEAALIAVVLGTADDAQRSAAWLEASDAVAPLSTYARARFDGWYAVHDGRYDDAIALLTDVAPNDGASGLGLGRALLGAGRDDDAHAQFLSVYHAQPGTAIGLLARHAYESATGRRAVLTNPIVAALEAVAKSVPSPVDRYPVTHSLATTIQIDTRERTLGPYDPVIVDITVRNNSPYPLAITRDGPLRSEIVIMIESDFRDEGPRYEVPPIVVGLDRRLCIPPHRALTFSAELNHYGVGGALIDAAPTGCSLRLRAVLNPIAVNDRRVKPGPLGGEDHTAWIRVLPPKRNDAAYRATLIETAETTGADGRMFALAMLSHLSIEPDSESYTLGPAERRRMQSALLRGFREVTPEERAWLVAAMPFGELLPDIRRELVANPEAYAAIVYLSRHLATPQDPMLEAIARRHQNDLLVRGVLDVALRRLQQRLQQP